ncbi:MAG: deoxyhypusine synthase family protein, partial [Candidatus Aenigmatarchaeota archaeon]
MILKIVKDFTIKGKISLRNLIKQMEESGGFQAKNLLTGIKILEDMIRDKSCIKFLSFPANIIATGTRGVIKDFLRKKFFDVVVTTCGTLDHDLSRS